MSDKNVFRFVALHIQGEGGKEENSFRRTRLALIRPIEICRKQRAIARKRYIQNVDCR